MSVGFILNITYICKVTGLCAEEIGYLMAARIMDLLVPKQSVASLRSACLSACLSLLLHHKSLVYAGTVNISGCSDKQNSFAYFSV
jgi:hypothetical protein